MIVHQPDPEESALIQEFMAEFLKVHYEPEHEDGITCWCGPVSRVIGGVHHIDHKEQRVQLRALFVQFLTRLSSLHANRKGEL